MPLEWAERGGEKQMEVKKEVVLENTSGALAFPLGERRSLLECFKQRSKVTGTF